nr:MAG: ORF1 [Anelloviridae sp.]
MPFWWRRRRKFWYTNRYKKNFRRWPKRRKRRTFRRRRRPAYGRRRRRRRRRYKVRRKKATITVKQWQPDSIVKCKIKGIGCLVAGAEGRQFYCYTNELQNYPQPRAPGGGGFGAEMFSLEYLYRQWLARRNVWTKSNDYKDLVRYFGTTITFFRHETTDFIVNFQRQPPFTLEKDYYNEIHPVNMLLSKHHKFIPSLKTKPYGPAKVKLRIKPPKQMLSKWFFQKDFANYGLFTLQGAACNMRWAYYGPDTQSRLITFYSLHTNFYKQTDWAQPRGSQTSPSPWYPYHGYPTTSPYDYYYNKKNPDQKKQINPTNYAESIDYEKGFFSPYVLQAWKIQQNSTPIHNLPITVARYNPDLDTGERNAVWLTSVISDSHWEQPRDVDLVIYGKPIWMALYGFWNYITKTKNDKTYMQHSMFVIKSPAIRLISPHTQDTFPIIDLNFIQGKLPWDETLTDTQKKFWYPTALQQTITINAFVESGPYIPKYPFKPESTWELKYRYISHFKWGGPEVFDQPVQNPQQQGKYDVPDTVSRTIQVSDPLKQTCQAMLRAWDWRRDYVTRTALKRMSEHLQTNSSVYSTDSEPSKKKRKRQQQKSHTHTKKRRASKTVSRHSAKKVHAKNQKTSSSSSFTSNSNSESSSSTSSSS